MFKEPANLWPLGRKKIAFFFTLKIIFFVEFSYVSVYKSAITAGVVI
jgi:hypothetical protein